MKSQNVYNPTAAIRDGKDYQLYRVDDTNKDLKWGPTHRIGPAVRDDSVSRFTHPRRF